MLEFLEESGFLKVLPTLPAEIWETLYSTVLSTLFAYIIGLPLGVLLALGDKGGIIEQPKPVMRFLNSMVNLLRSVPFLILMIIVLPLSEIIIGTRIGTAASVPPLVIAAFPFIARMVEGSVREVDRGVVEAAESMGCSPWQIITKVILPESLPSLISGATISLTTILGYGAMAGIIGGGGLGKVAINYGYYRYNFVVMIAAVVLLVLIVAIFQSVGNSLAVRLDKRITQNKRRKKK